VKINRYVPAQLAIGVALIAAAAGCGGSSSASTGSAPQSAAVNIPPPPRKPLSSPEVAVRSYIEGVQAVNGDAICNSLAGALQRSIMTSIVRARPKEAGASCGQAMTGLVEAITSPSEAHAKLPRFRVKQTSGDTAVVTYVGAASHKLRTFVLVKSGPGWLIEKINGKG
jgi:hypothetical protein